MLILAWVAEIWFTTKPNIISAVIVLMDDQEDRSVLDIERILAEVKLKNAISCINLTRPRKYRTIKEAILMSVSFLDVSSTMVGQAKKRNCLATVIPTALS